MIEEGRDSGSEEEGESRILDAAEEADAWEKMEDTEERMLDDMLALERWWCEEMDIMVGSVAKAANSMCISASW